MNDEITEGTWVKVDLSVRFEDVDLTVTGLVYHIRANERRPYCINSKGRVVKASEDAIVEVLDKEDEPPAHPTTETAQDGGAR